MKGKLCKLVLVPLSLIILFKPVGDLQASLKEVQSLSLGLGPEVVEPGEPGVLLNMDSVS